MMHSMKWCSVGRRVQYMFDITLRHPLAHMFIWTSLKAPAVYFWTQEWESCNCQTLKALAFSESNNTWLWREHLHVFKGAPARAREVARETKRDGVDEYFSPYAHISATTPLPRHPLVRTPFPVSVEPFGIFHNQSSDKFWNEVRAGRVWQ